jgi:hypothetical protein
MWEYKIITLERDWKSSEFILNEKGKQGWELVAINDTLYYFKRFVDKPKSQVGFTSEES